MLGLCTSPCCGTKDRWLVLTLYANQQFRTCLAEYLCGLCLIREIPKTSQLKIEFILFGDECVHYICPRNYPRTDPRSRYIILGFSYPRSTYLQIDLCWTKIIIELNGCCGCFEYCFPFFFFWYMNMWLWSFNLFWYFFLLSATYWPLVIFYKIDIHCVS